MAELYVHIFPNGKRYIGYSSATAKRRFKDHCGLARNGSDLPVHRAIRKYGQDNVVLRVLCIGGLDYILNLEIEAIRLFDTRNPKKGYNVGPGGNLSPVLDERVRLKIRETKSIPENRIRYSTATTAVHARPEFKELHREAVKAAHARPEVKERHTAAVRATFSNPDIIESIRIGTIASWDGERRQSASSYWENYWNDPVASAARRESIATAHSSNAVIENHRAAAQRQHANPGTKGRHVAGVRKACSGTRWITDGVSNRRIRDESTPEGWRFGFTVRTP